MTKNTKKELDTGQIGNINGKSAFQSACPGQVLLKLGKNQKKKIESNESTRVMDLEKLDIGDDVSWCTNSMTSNNSDMSCSVDSCIAKKTKTWKMKYTSKTRIKLRL